MLMTPGLDDSPSITFHFLPSDDGLCRSSLNQDVWTDSPQQFVWCRIIKDHDPVNTVNCCDEFRSVLLGNKGPSCPFRPPHGLITVDCDDQDVTLIFSPTGACAGVRRGTGRNSRS